jgi:hypothetical protein
MLVKIFYETTVILAVACREAGGCAPPDVVAREKLGYTLTAAWVVSCVSWIVLE